MKLVLLCTLLASACFAAVNGRPSQDAEPLIVAKLSPKHCRQGTQAGQAGTLSAATIQTASQAAAAVGLSFRNTVPARCWVRLNRASTPEATAAAIASLQAPAVVVSSGGGDVTTPEPLFQYVSEDILLYAQDTARSLLQEATGAKALAKPAALPIECSNSSCPRLWGMNRIKAPQAWEAVGPVIPAGVGAMVIDTGVDMTHNDIVPQVDAAQSVTFSALDNNMPPGGVADNDDHGTHVFGTMAGGWGTFNGQTDPNGIAGVAGPTQNTVLSCNSFGTRNTTQWADVAFCLAHARSRNAHWVVNLSIAGLGSAGGTIETFLRDSLQEFCDAGGLAIIAAGNGVCTGTGCPGGPNRVFIGVDTNDAGLNPDFTRTPGRVVFPAIMAKFFPDCVLAVANTNPQDTLSPTSNWGEFVRIAAPGSRIFSDVLTRDGNQWAAGVKSGTSMASPHVAGAALLIKNSFREASSKQVIDCIVSTADMVVQPAQPDSIINAGILNVKAAYDCVKELFPGNSSSPSPSPSPGPKAVCIGTPPKKQHAFWTCGETTEAGNTCVAQCFYGFQGAFVSTCQDDGTWGPVTGPGCSDSTSSCGDCTAQGLCTKADGCQCVADVNGRRCLCEQSLGFREVTLPFRSGPLFKSFCRWNIVFSNGTSLRAPRGSRVALQYAIRNGNGALFCTASNVVTSVAFDFETGMFPCPQARYARLTRSSDRGARERCNRNTNRYRIPFTVSPPPARNRNSRCALLVVRKSDGSANKLIIQVA